METSCYRKGRRKNTSPAGNILESYKIVAEQVIAYNPDTLSTKVANCIYAATLHLITVSNEPPGDNTPIYVSFTTTHGYTGCVVWVYNLERAKAVSRDVLEAFRRLHSSDEA